jgi:hypothetical protein
MHELWIFFNNDYVVCTLMFSFVWYFMIIKSWTLFDIIYYGRVQREHYSSTVRYIAYRLSSAINFKNKSYRLNAIHLYQEGKVDKRRNQTNVDSYLWKLGSSHICLHWTQIHKSDPKRTHEETSSTTDSCILDLVSDSIKIKIQHIAEVTKETAIQDTKTMMRTALATILITTYIFQKVEYLD